jgi:uncharacterized phage-associated protein
MAVANWFIERSSRELNHPNCDPMKLNKLAFYAHGWHLGITGSELFPEDVEAWPHGPVVRDLYVEFKDFGRNPITRLGERLELKDGEPAFVIPEHDGTLASFFEKIWDVYGSKTGIQLSNMTHKKGEPWEIVAEKYGYDLSEKPTIPSDIIRAAFERRIQPAGR